jgi:3',5'-cyclic AMP phosphodiesterase CpdA
MILLVCGLVLVAFSRDAGAESFIHTSRSSEASLSKPSEEESFSFAVFGDRTGGPDSGLLVLERAVTEVNTLGPDLVMTVGDLVSGYNQKNRWLKEMREYKEIVNRLRMPWFPVAGNHDTYWRGEGKPENEHDGNYEKHFGPLWYAFEHKNCWFIVLYSDEGNPDTGEKSFAKPECQVMSPQQTHWLRDTLKLTTKAPHVFVFVHHPRWLGGHYGDSWKETHGIFQKAGNVSAVFAGHNHRMKFDGVRDGIHYFRIGTTGGVYGKRNPLEGSFHHYDMVTVRGSEFHVAAVPVGSVIDPKSVRRTQTLLEENAWSIDSEQTRRLTYPIKIPTFDGAGAVIRIGVMHAVDDSGDKGLTYALLDPSSEVVSRGFLNSSDYQWIKHAVTPKQNLLLILADADTEFTGNKPGNGGRIMIELDVVLKSP